MEISGSSAAAGSDFRSSKTSKISPSPFSAMDWTMKSRSMRFGDLAVDLVSDSFMSDSTENPLLLSLFMVFPTTKKK